MKLQHADALTTTDACRGLGKYGGLFICVLPQMACSDASSHVWWDEFHPTETVNRILAENVWSGEHTKMCYPVDLQEMVKLKNWNRPESSLQVLAQLLCFRIDKQILRGRTVECIS
jgi:phospholipase/lecithinase/hemolysin